MPEIRNIGLGGIAVKPERLRALRDGVVQELMESMKARGLVNPITLRPKPSAGYWLVAGRHRLEAARKLKWTGIKATIVEGLDADAAELIEIDENLIRADLSPAERALHVDRRKTLYEKRHPEAKKGATGRSGKKNKSNNGTYKPADAFIDDTAKKTGKGRSTVALDAQRGKDNSEWLKDVAGTALDKGNEIDALIKLPVRERNALIKRAKSGEKVSAKTRLNQVKRDQREAETAARIVALPTKKYGVILEDFEWDHETWSDAGKDRHASNHYSTSANAHSAEEIVERTKDRFECAADDCVLWMWTTVPHQAIAFDVMRLRGFSYKSSVVWDKEIGATGYWFIGHHEVLLVGTRGNVPAPAPGTQWQSIIRERRREHSRKPDKSYEMIEAYFPKIPKIELNCRGEPRPGWDGWGNEAKEVAA